MSTETLTKLSDILETLINQESPGKQRDSNSINALLNSVLISYENRKLDASASAAQNGISEIQIVMKILAALTKMFQRNPSLLVDENRHLTVLKSIFPFFNYLNYPMELTDDALFTLVQICTESFKRGLLIHDRLLAQQKDFTLGYLDELLSEIMKSFTNPSQPSPGLNQGESALPIDTISIEKLNSLHHIKLSKISITVKILLFLTHPSISKLLFAKHNTSYILDSYITKSWFCLENIVINIRFLNEHQELVNILDNVYSTLLLSTVNYYLNDDSHQMNRLQLAVSSCRTLLNWPLLHNFNNLQTVLSQCLLKLTINLKELNNEIYLFKSIGLSDSSFYQFGELIEDTKHADLKRCLLLLLSSSSKNKEGELEMCHHIRKVKKFNNHELQALELRYHPPIETQDDSTPVKLTQDLTQQIIDSFDTEVPHTFDEHDITQLIKTVEFLGKYSCYISDSFDLWTQKCKLCDSNYSISSYVMDNIKIDRPKVDKGSKIEEVLRAISSIIRLQSAKENQHLILTIVIALTRIFRAFRAPGLSDMKDVWNFIKTCFASPLREVRMLTVKILPLLIHVPEDSQYESDIDTIMSFLFSITLERRNYYVFEGYISTLGELLMVKAVDSRYYIILRQLILFMAETSEFISNLSIFQLKQVATTKNMTPWKIVEPFIPLISRDVVKSYKKTSGLLENFCIAIEMSQRVFLTRTLSYTVPFLVDLYSDNPIAYISSTTGITQDALIESHLSGILAYLFATHNDISSSRILNILSLYDSSYKNKSFDDLVLACKGPFFLYNLLYHYNSEPKTLERIRRGVGVISATIYHEKNTDRAIQLMLDRWLLILVQLISTTLNDKKGSNPYTMKIRAIKSILCLAQLCDNFEACLGQVVTSLQLALQHKELRTDALVCLKTIVSTSSVENLKFISDTLLSQFIQLFDSFSTKNKEIVTETIFLLMKAVPESHLSYRFGLGKISSMRNVNFQHASDRKLVGDFRERMKSDNKWVLEQALDDFIEYLERGQINIQIQFKDDELLRNSFQSITEFLISHSLKTQSANSRDDDRTDTSKIAQKTAIALSLLGNIDLTDTGNRSTAGKAYDNVNNFLLVTNLQKPKPNEQEQNSVVEFSVFFLKNILVRSFIFSVDPEEQRYISYVIQEYMSIFEIPDKAWKELDALTRNVLTPLKTSRYRQTTAATIYAFPLYHQYKEFSVWLKELTANLLHKCASIAAAVFKSPEQIKYICDVIPILDTTINRFVLPYAILFLIVTEPENSTDKKQLQNEFMLILENDLKLVTNEVVKETLKKSVVTILEIFQFLKAWNNKINEEEDITRTNNKAHTKLKRTGILRVEKFLNSFPTTTLAQRCADCEIYEGALLFAEKSYKENTMEKVDLFSTLKDMYVELEDFDQLHGALKTFSTNSLSDKLLQFKYNEDAQVSNESLTAIAQYDLDDIQSCQNGSLFTKKSVTELFDVLNRNCEYNQLLLNLKKFKEKAYWVNFSMGSCEWILHGLQASIYTGDIADLENWSRLGEKSHFLTIPGSDLSVYYEVAQALIALKYNLIPCCCEHIDTAISYIGLAISSSQNTIYRKIPEYLALLHSLYDFRQISKMDGKNETTIQSVKRRFQASKMDFRSKWKIHSMKSSIYKLHRGEYFQELYKDSLVEGCQILRESGRLPQATKLITKALVLNEQNSATEMTQASTLLMNVEFSKLFWAQNDYETALKNMKMVVDNMNTKNSYYLDFTLTYLNWLDESAEGSSDEIKKRYLQLISDSKFSTSADVFYHYATYLSKVLEAQILVESDGTLDIDVIRYYFLAVRYSKKYVHEVLPKAVTLWLDYYQKYLALSSGTDISRKLLDSRNTTYQKINLLVEKCVPELGTKWYVVLSQIISRITHEDKKVTDTISKMIIGLTVEYPTILLYSIFAQARSVDNNRRAVGTRILAKLQDSRAAKDSSLPKLIASGLILLESIMAVCNSSQNYKHPKSGIMVKDLYKDLNFNYPRNSPCLSLALPIKYNMDLLYNLRNDANKKIVHYSKFHEKVRILFSLQQPKRVKVTGTNGAIYFLLFKPKDDLRKDNKVMEFSTVMNGLLAKDYETQRRNMHIKSFAATPLNEATGIIEWVQNFVTLRPIIEKQLKRKNISLNLRNMKSEFGDAKDEDKLDIYKSYLQKYPPALGEWMIENAPNVAEWYRSRSLFTRSLAVMSMVGYLIGVGDRHLDNIMINKNTGMIMHIDFDCMFEKGKRLGVPEIVPFRLTPNLIDAMGVLGYEGSFRKSSELTMSLIRGNEIILMNFLESFIHDPLMDWRGSTSSTSAVRAEERIQKIKRTQERVYKIIRRKIRGVLTKDDDNTNYRDSGGLSVSVSLQVELLIQTSSSHENLSKMFFGWMPFL